MTTTTSPLPDGLAGLPLATTSSARGDFVSEAEVRWCPGCGDYAVLAAFQSFLPSLGIPRENMVVVSGIGCSSRFPYYVDTYGMHSIHGRALPIATGIAVARPDLTVWVVTGDGDALSIGGNHLIHALRRNVNCTILLFNNRIYGLTKGQYSPTSEQGKVTKSSPVGSPDYPFNPVSLALGAEATFVARAIDSDRAGLTEILHAAAAHRGAALVEIYQNCPIFNDGAYATLKGAESGDHLIRLVDGEPIIWAQGNRGLTRDPVSGALSPVDVAEAGIDHIVRHDATREDPSLAFALSRLSDLTARIDHTPIGIFRRVDRPTYDDVVREQVTVAGDRQEAARALQQVLVGPDPWTIV
ncbi:MAG: 2-oxoacid:ferredoxin oxidoreductase subunit beta [Propionibacteriaceae bacterium]|jgi:2-oxoglutarate ferredoxin oxidoreductase subunit beta|nr:2-oxoacid:ferredoxin oxidoreductase subunit beta [Propionibacteriaceae bacterium]